MNGIKSLIMGRERPNSTCSKFVSEWCMNTPYQETAMASNILMSATMLNTLSHSREVIDALADV